MVEKYYVLTEAEIKDSMVGIAEDLERNLPYFYRSCKVLFFYYFVGNAHFSEIYSNN